MVTVTRVSVRRDKVEKIFAEEIEKQLQSLLQVISGNFAITIEETKYFKSEVNELKKSIEFTEEVLFVKVSICRGKLVA